jgi:ABC-2 type transport system ATP-binding protein
MITTKNITKYFGSFQALQDVSFEINKGEIVGFLGQNGAGKTTLMRILTSYLPASSGTVMIDGDDIAKNSLTIRQKIGYLPENPPLYENMTVKDYLKFAAEIKDVPLKQRRRQLDKVLEECHIQNVMHNTIETLSKGYKQRVGIAQAIIHEPKILILDEPTSGLDPVQNLQVRNLIKDLEEKRTVILSTHILSEIEQIAHRVIIIKSGRIIVDESLETLLKTQDDTKGTQLVKTRSSQLVEKQSSRLTLEEVFIKLHSESNDE